MWNRKGREGRKEVVLPRYGHFGCLLQAALLLGLAAAACHGQDAAIFEKGTHETPSFWRIEGDTIYPSVFQDEAPAPDADRGSGLRHPQGR